MSTSQGLPADTTELRKATYHEALSSIEEIIEDARNGRMFILIDDEDRENEGDLVIPAQMATPEAINFMARFGRGLICLAMTKERIDELGLPLMPRKHSSRHETAFTVSIEAKEGVTTGISAADRALTVAVAIDPGKGRDEIVTPGHVFPLVARDGGVLVRAGHTEAAVDLARMAGLIPAGVICEIMNDDGTMARLPDLVQFAQYHGLKVGTIADLIAHRRRTESIVRRALESQLDSIHGGPFRMVIYVNKVTYAEHIALVKGDISTPEPVLTRMHAMNVLDDVLGDKASGKGGELQKAMTMIAEAGRGVIVLIREPTATALSDTVRARLDNERAGGELRDYGVGAQILLDLGLHDLILLSNSQKTIVGLDGYGLNIVERRPIRRES
ncbi:MAG: 3,4-dihydroxy-2-butanone-4-phosphate synthase [Alphaproteobacteria bacterium]|nr:3,4-dihydroxy-2-butanone-4-phosphate synthase [Alphaproteobacteria bacterium]MBU0887814.1 3,4-dihydroxy-2-butanone-4-phosphate synthase [Alphaproteobacteria bacterium]MBU1814963.1 3,4-dihydroxy-2-butanone-4-phosphate synthase [Alphaproteobacteria bacterium]MBU2091390.1 3,4-dihydroxy-2-butanone-4-phosphate synthase [Alphaproteobacteria bacterium]